VRLERTHDIPVWTSPLLDNVPGVRHAFTTRGGGGSIEPYSSMNLSLSVGDDAGAVGVNRAALAGVLGVDAALIRLQTQVHGADVLPVPSDPNAPPVEGDAFFTAQAGLPAVVGVADCVPVLLAAEDGRAVAAVHAGWRGAVAGVVRSTIGVLHRQHGVSPEELRAAVGPAIGLCCFEVGGDVAEQFDDRFVLRAGDRPHVDLSAYVESELTSAGIADAHIDRADVCTKCRADLCFSHRGSGGTTGRMVGIIVRNA